MSVYDEMLERYQSGTVPWDDRLPPPEVVEWVDSQSPGRALDLGCGFGRTSIYLALHAWLVDAVDFIPQAIAEAVARARSAGVISGISFHATSVAELNFLRGPYDFAVDVGCLHVLDKDELRSYRDGLLRLLPAGATYLLFARLKQPSDETADGPRGLPEAAIKELFSDGFTLERVEHGETQVEDSVGWSSAWFWFRRRRE